MAAPGVGGSWSIQKSGIPGPGSPAPGRIPVPKVLQSHRWLGQSSWYLEWTGNQGSLAWMLFLHETLYVVLLEDGRKPQGWLRINFPPLRRGLETALIWFMANKIDISCTLVWNKIISLPIGRLSDFRKIPSQKWHQYVTFYYLNTLR